jgi:hypothetical protein
MFLNLGLMGGTVKPRTFGAKGGVERSTLTTSRKCYPAFHGTEMLLTLEMTLTRELLVNLNPLSTILVVGGEGTMADVEYSLDGGAWTSADGVWGTSRYIQVRGTSSASYETTLSADIHIGGYDYLFYVTTRAQVLGEGALNPDDSSMLNPDNSQAYNPE